MRVKFWGTRGSIPTPGPQTIRYGGNTSCVEVRTSAGTLMILDCGTGIRDLGRNLLRPGAGSPITGHIFISHTHWDHIQGFPFFAPLFLPGNAFTIYGPHHMDHTLETAMAGQMEHAYFPVRLQELAARIDFQELEGEAIAVEDTIVSFLYVNHTTVCLAYRIEGDGAALVYVTDTEPHSSYLHSLARRGDAPTGGKWEEQAQRFAMEADRRLVEFASGADLLVMDSQYTPEEYDAKRGWGHSHLDYVVDIACAAQVKRLALFHHDPDRTDSDLDAFQDRCRERARQQRPGLEVMAASDGLELALG